MTQGLFALPTTFISEQSGPLAEAVLAHAAAHPCSTCPGSLKGAGQAQTTPPYTDSLISFSEMLVLLGPHREATL